MLSGDAAGNPGRMASILEAAGLVRTAQQESFLWSFHLYRRASVQKMELALAKYLRTPTYNAERIMEQIATRPCPIDGGQDYRVFRKLRLQRSQKATLREGY